MGQMAARMALRMVHGESMDGPRVELATQLVVRESTLPL
jgi:LacI family transcriptional regulator